MSNHHAWLMKMDENRIQQTGVRRKRNSLQRVAAGAANHGY
jgi:hypothetical protein